MYPFRYCRSIFVFACWLIVANVEAQPLNQRLESAYRTFATHQSLAHGIASLTVLHGGTGDVIFAKNEQVGLATASTLKNITAATAYHVLGPMHTFETELYYTGTLGSDGVLQGDLIIKGTGDPTLGSDRYPNTLDENVIQAWVDAVRASGIRSIEGRVIGNDRHYGGMTAPHGWPWRDLGNYYGAGVSALNWQENSVGIEFAVGRRVGDPTTVRSTTSDLSYLELANETTTGPAGSGDNVYAFAAPYSTRIYLRGTHGIDLRKTIRIALPDAAYHAAYQLHHALGAAGMAPTAAPTTAQTLRLASVDVPDTGTSLHVHHSPQLAEIVYWFNQKSINLYGEALLLAVAKSAGDDLDATTFMRDFWADKLQLAPGELRIQDGSGLSPGNRVTTRAMARILASLRQEPWFASFHESLPTIHGITMKSGTIGGVLGYAGYHTAKDGTPLVFALLVNNYEGPAQAMRNRMFRLLDTLKE